MVAIKSEELKKKKKIWTIFMPLVTALVSLQFFFQFPNCSAVQNFHNIYTVRTLAWATKSRLGEIEYFSTKKGSHLGHSFSLRRDRVLQVEERSRLGDHVLA